MCHFAFIAPGLVISGISLASPPPPHLFSATSATHVYVKEKSLSPSPRTLQILSGVNELNTVKLFIVQTRAPPMIVFSNNKVKRFLVGKIYNRLLLK